MDNLCAVPDRNRYSLRFTFVLYIKIDVIQTSVITACGASRIVFVVIIIYLLLLFIYLFYLFSTNIDNFLISQNLFLPKKQTIFLRNK